MPVVKNVLWGALAQDLGIRPRIVGKMHLVNLNKKVLIHPYDDRGVDIYSPDNKFMGNLFKKYNGYLLDYDRAKMNSVYGTI